MRSAYILLFLIFFSITVNAQNLDVAQWNYNRFPDIPFELEHVNMHLTIESDPAQINGVAEYQILSRREALTEIIFHTADLEIQSITTGETELEYHINKDSLFILLNDSLTYGRQKSIHITWQSESIYGIHTDAYGNLWTSLNPQMLHHWLPILDHPQVRATFDVEITAPIGMTPVFNGQFLQKETLSDDKVITYWGSKNKIPVTQFTLALGKFSNSNALSGIKKIALYATENLLSRNERDSLLDIAVRSLKETERSMAFEYPYESLNIVVLPDHYWNEIQYGAGMIYLYQNLGSLSTQIKRGIASQWFGSYQSYLNEISKASQYEFLKTQLIKNPHAELLKNKDSLHTISAWNDQIDTKNSMNSSFFASIVKQSLSELVRTERGITGWNEYAEFWYDKTGIYWQHLPVYEYENSTEDSIIRYSVDYQLNEQSNILTLDFQALDEIGISSLTDVIATQYSFGDTISTSFSFTGLKDIVDLKLSGAVDYITLHTETESPLILVEEKPFLYFINQLRSSNAELREKAARGLMNYKDHPDLQLALSDALSRETNTDVKAALLRTLGAVLKGAAGTDATFIEHLRNDDIGIRKSALQSLAHYPGNENVAYALQNVLLRTSSDSLFKAALQSYAQVKGTDAVIQIADRLLKADSTGFRSLKAYNLAVEEDTTGRSIEMVTKFLDVSFPYDIRNEALNLILKHQQEEMYWETILPELLPDKDPRMRYLALEGLHYLNEEKRNEWLEMRKEEEYDIRVLNRINLLMN